VIGPAPGLARGGRFFVVGFVVVVVVVIVVVIGEAMQFGVPENPGRYDKLDYDNDNDNDNDNDGTSIR
jgi:hypothetical protein